MGDPRKIRSKYQGPRHPWNKERIEHERELSRTYGLTNKKELWKAESKLKTFKDNAKQLIARTDAQSEKELKQLYKKLQSLKLAGQDVSADEVLGLQTAQLLERRLQTLVFKKELARSIKQARQFITHGHIFVDGKKMTVPGYLVLGNEESRIEFNNNSSLFSADHPERAIQKVAVPGKKEEGKTAKEKAEETLPVTATEETKEEEKPIEQKIEEETDNAAEVAEAVSEAEADTIAADHEEAVNKAAQDADNLPSEDETKEDQK